MLIIIDPTPTTFIEQTERSLIYFISLLKIFFQV